ncbi:hypothetical protein P3T76_014121 [Phytophthora citrophthora]|uniref:FLYWCH-type domain-containing protein n=1 Tax=Phytophthora citrophthora TaxID=4793 RepID=A0AAD9G294_9STRA|nr:hypothetical protein P3T76_014121 [Phytophthora citrophthora]
MARGNLRAQSTGEREFDTTLNHRGFEYTRAWYSNVKMVFWCKVYRSKKCKARLELRPAVEGYTFVNAHTSVEPLRSSTGIEDCTKAMKERVDTLAIFDLTRSVHKLWKQVCSEFYKDDDIIRKGLSEEQVSSRVYRDRQKHYGPHMLGLVEIPPLSMVEGKPLSFFQFHVSRPKADPTSKPDRLIGWAHPELRQLLMYNGVSLFFDGTFRCVPSGFKQCMVLMVHDQASELFIPVYYVLFSSKAKDISSRVTLSATSSCRSFTLLKSSFPTQRSSAAVRRRMKATYGIPDRQVRIAMKKGVLDVLTVIDPKLVPREGIRWVKRTIRSRCIQAGLSYSRSKWKLFWGYFRATWIDRLENSLVARTNNPLERFHLELNRSFPTPHPNIVTFVLTIRTISQDFVTKLSDVAQGRRKRGRNATQTNRNVHSFPAALCSTKSILTFHHQWSDAASDSESEIEMEGSGESSGDDTDRSDDAEAADSIPDTSYEPKEYCDDVESNCEAVV